MPTGISMETVKHVAKLARLDITNSEAKSFQKELAEILGAFKTLDKVKAVSTDLGTQQNVWREDKVEKSLSQDEAFANTKHVEKGFFKGPKVMQ